MPDLPEVSAEVIIPRRPDYISQSAAPGQSWEGKNKGNGPRLLVGAVRLELKIGQGRWSWQRVWF